MVNLLMRLCKEQKNASIYFLSGDTSRFVYGQIIAANKNFIAIYMVSPDGYPDGILIRETKKIIRIEIDNQYGEKIKDLSSFYHSSETFKPLLDVEDIVTSMLLAAKSKGKVVTLELVNSGYDDVVGFVDFIEQKELRIKQINSFGVDDGYSYVNTSDITQITCDSQDEKRILILNSKSKK